MPSAVTLPTFYEREKLLYQKLNAAMSAINAKFLAGVGAAELAWPLTAGGNLDMSVYNITGGRQIWGFVNAAEYDTLDDAITAAGSGGVVLVPPETTIPSSGSSVTGTGVTVIGSGPSSVIQLTAGATGGYALLFNSATRGMLANLTLDGNSATGSDQEGLRIADCTGMVVTNVFFRNFSGAAVKIQGGTSQVSIMGCHFNGGTVEQLSVTQCEHLAVVACTFDTAGDEAIKLNSGSGTAYISAAIGDTHIDACTGAGVSFSGFNSVGTTSPASLWMSNCSISSTGSAGILAGVSGAVLEACHIHGCSLETCVGGIKVNANYGSVSDNTIHDTSSYGVDFESSRYINVTDNYIYNTTIGVDATSGQNCRVSGNILRSCTTPVDFGGTNHTINDNVGAYHSAQFGGYDMVVTPGATLTTTDSGTVSTLNIPAGVLRQGSVVEVWAYGRVTTVDDSATMQLRINGAVLASAQVTDTGNESYMLRGHCVVTSCADDEAFGFGYGAADGQSDLTIAYNGTNITIDCSTVALLTVHVTAGVDLDSSTFRVYQMGVKYGHAQVRTFS